MGESYKDPEGSNKITATCRKRAGRHRRGLRSSRGRNTKKALFSVERAGVRADGRLIRSWKESGDGARVSRRRKEDFFDMFFHFLTSEGSRMMHRRCPQRAAG